MTLVEIIAAIIGSNVLTALVTAWLQRGQTRAEVRKNDVESEHTAVDTASDVMGMIKAAYEERVSTLEIKLKAETARADANDTLVAELKKSRDEARAEQNVTLARLASTEARLAQSESRTTDAEKRVAESRQDIIKVGTQIQEYRRLVNELGEIMGVLIGQIKKMGVEPDLSPDLLKRIAEINAIYRM